MPGIRRLQIALLAVVLSGGCAWKRHAREGDAAMQAQDYASAVAAYGLAVHSKPNRPELQAKLAAAQSARVADLETQAHRELAAGHCLQAIASTKSAVQLLPQATKTRNLADEVVGQCRDRARAHTAQAQYARARELLTAMLHGLPAASEGVRADLDATTADWIKQLRQRVATTEPAGLNATALLYATQLLVLEGQARTPEYQNLRTRALDSASYRVHLAFDPSDATAQYFAARLSQLHSSALITIAVPAAHSDASLSIMPAPAELTRHAEHHEQSFEFQSGTVEVINPEFRTIQDQVFSETERLVGAKNAVTRAQDRLDRVRNELARACQRAGDVGDLEHRLHAAERDLSRAREQVLSQRNVVLEAERSLAHTEQILLEPVYSTVALTITTHIHRAQLHLTGALRPTDGGQALPIDILVEYVDQDHAHPALPMANIPEDPLDLASETQMIDQLRARAMPSLKSTLKDGHLQFRSALLAQVRTTSGPEELEGLLRYTLSDLGQPAPKVDQRIFELSGVPNAASLLRPLLER